MQAKSPAPLFLLAGGRRATAKGRRPDPLLQQALEASGKLHPQVAYLGSASEDDPGFFNRIWHPERRRPVRDPERAPFSDGRAGAPVCGTQRHGRRNRQP